jgi:hypothetical protein
MENEVKMIRFSLQGSKREISSKPKSNWIFLMRVINLRRRNAADYMKFIYPLLNWGKVL